MNGESRWQWRHCIEKKVSDVVDGVVKQRRTIRETKVPWVRPRDFTRISMTWRYIND
jgi:hypothetical protein